MTRKINKNERHPELPVILMTAYISQDKLEQAQQIGVADIWFKPFDIEVVRKKLRAFRETRKQSLV